MESRGTTQNCREPHKMAWNHAKPHRTTYELSTVSVRCLQIFFFLQINIVFCLYQFRVLDKHHTHKCMCVCMCACARAYTHTHTHTVHTHNHTPPKQQQHTNKNKKRKQYKTQTTTLTIKPSKNTRWFMNLKELLLHTLWLVNFYPLSHVCMDIPLSYASQNHILWWLHTHALTHTRMHACTHARMHTHTHTHTHTNKHTHTHTNE